MHILGTFAFGAQAAVYPLADMLATLFAGAEAFTLPDVSSSRRAVLSNAAASFAVLAAPSAALAVSARTGLEAPFTGEYDDPKASGCLRSVKVVGPKMGPDGRRPI